ncbi:MAG: hypothetical protein ACREEW_03710 [Caulobacteraceae bacterium]
MNRLLTRVQLAYLGVFVVICIGMFAYQAVYVWPVRRCEAHGGWWSPKYHQCATPIPISRFTGRLPRGPSPPGDTAAQRVAPGAQSTSPRPSSLQ